MIEGGINGGPCISGVADCPECGYPVMVNDWRVPELCDDCQEDVISEHPVSEIVWPYDDDPRDK
jgi:hypothetical protein